MSKALRNKKMLFIAMAVSPIALTNAHATAVSQIDPTVSDPFLMLYNVAQNSLGFSSGELIRFGATAVTPDGSAGTTAYATTRDTATGAIFSRNIIFNPGPATPHLFTRTVAYNPNLLGPWTLNFSNGNATTTQTLTLPSGAAELPFVNSISLSGSQQQPTFTWTPPSGTTINGYRVNIYDKSLLNQTDPNNRNTGLVVSRNLAPGTTSFSVTPDVFTVPGYAFSTNHNYSIEISAFQTRDGLSNNLNNNNIYAMSRVYADFTPSTTNGPAVNLPVKTANGSYKFDISVDPGVTYYIDPAVATGYVYETGASDPNFRSVTLPVGIGDGLYDLYGFDSSNMPVLLMHDLAGGLAYDFGTSGVSRFEVLGIEASAMLDPGNTTAFVTGLTFVNAGTFTGTQTPITTTIPEPTTTSLMALGLGLFGLIGIRSKTRDRR